MGCVQDQTYCKCHDQTKLLSNDQQAFVYKLTKQYSYIKVGKIKIDEQLNIIYSKLKELQQKLEQKKANNPQKQSVQISRAIQAQQNVLKKVHEKLQKFNHFYQFYEQIYLEMKKNVTQQLKEQNREHDCFQYVKTKLQKIQQEGNNQLKKNSLSSEITANEKLIQLIDQIMDIIEKSKKSITETKNIQSQLLLSPLKKSKNGVLNRSLKNSRKNQNSSRGTISTIPQLQKSTSSRQLSIYQSMKSNISLYNNSESFLYLQKIFSSQQQIESKYKKNTLDYIQTSLLHARTQMTQNGYRLCNQILLQFQVHSNIPIDFKQFFRYSWQQLEFIALNGCEINDTKWAMLVKNASLLKKIKWIRIYDNSITHVMQRDLKQFTYLKRIDFTAGNLSNPLTNATKVNLTNFKKVFSDIQVIF